MTPGERRAATGLAAIYGFRMLGLFLILPVFALFAEDLPESTPLLIGIAIGSYGLTQALLQIPFGLLSDRLGRKPVILAGLLLFAIGSVVAAMADDIWTIILGRIIQGSGAIAAAVMALAADLTRESQRTKAMAMIGMTIGVSFMLALIAGPALNAWIGISGIFWLTASLAIGGMLIVVWLVPTPARSGVHRDSIPVPAMLKKSLAQMDLLRLDFGIFSLHLILTALFLAIPLVLRDAGLAPVDHANLYLPVLVCSIAAMIPFVILAERKGKMKQVFLGAILTLFCAQFLLSQVLDDLWLIGLGLWLFFTAFNLLEAMLPSLVSKTAPADGKGTAMGIYSSSQFMGAFLGGVFGGLAHQYLGLEAVFQLSILVGLVWWLVAFGMQQPGRYSSRLLQFPEITEEQASLVTEKLNSVEGVVEAVVVAEDGVAYLKVEKHRLDQQALARIAHQDAR